MVDSRFDHSASSVTRRDGDQEGQNGRSEGINTRSGDQEDQLLPLISWSRVENVHVRSRPWSATSNASWIIITGGASGTGNGTVSYAVEAYTGKPKNRNGSLVVAGQTFSVKQS
jgi:hypothetical protein